MPRTPRAGHKPRTLHIDPLHVRARRGPDAEGRWYWRADWYSDGRDHSRAIGWATELEARRLAADLVAAEAFTRPKSRDADRVDTVGDLLEVWLGQRQLDASAGGVSASTLEMYVARSRHLKAGLGDIQLARLTVNHLERHRNARLREAAPRTVEHELRVLRLAWNWGESRGHTPAGRLSAVRVRVDDATFVNNHRTPTRDEVAAVLAHMEGWPRLATLLLAATGARVGEIASLRWGSVDLDEGWIRVVGKTGPRDIPVPRGVVEELRRVGPGAGDAPVLGKAESTVIVGLQHTFLPRACEAAGVARFTPHGLRRLASMTLADAGVDVATYAALLGHSPAVAIRRYQEVTPERRRKAAAAALLGVFSDEPKVVEFPGQRKPG